MKNIDKILNKREKNYIKQWSKDSKLRSLHLPESNKREIIKMLIGDFSDEAFYLVDVKQLQKRIDTFQKYFIPQYPNRKIAYSVKANSFKPIVDLISDAGICCFDCSSILEIDFSYF